MSNTLARLLPTLLLLTVGCANALAQQFSAELVRLKPEGAPPSRVMVSGDMMRFETLSPVKRSIMVVDLKQKTGFMAFPDDKMYSVLPPGQILPTTPFFHPADPENACEAWEKLVNKPGTCSKVGDETINGRQVVKYKGSARNGDTGTVWVDRKIRYVVKWEGQATSAELRNIQEGPQSAALFEAPKNYQVMSSKASRKGAMKKAPPKTSPPQNPQ